MSVRIPDFYIFPQFGGPSLSAQYPNLRNSFGWLNAVMRNSFIDESTNLTTHVLRGLAWGELMQRFKFRWWYEAADDEFQLQLNAADSEIDPVWTTIIKIRESDGRVTITGTGGLLVTGGFYNFGGLDVAVTQLGGAQFGNVGTLLFDSNSGFYIHPDSSGRPIVSVNAAAAAGALTDLANLGAGAQVFKNKVASTANLRSIVAGTNVSVTQNADDITIAATDTGEANTASNLGAGFGIWFDKQGVDLRFKSLIAGSNISITPTDNDLTIASTASGGGGGGFYGILFKESEANGYQQRDDEVNFDSAAFYVADNNRGKPLVSLKGNISLTDLDVSKTLTLTETDTPTTPSAGQVRIWAGDEVSNFSSLKFMDSSGRVLRSARDQIALVRNQTGSTIPAMSVVYIIDATGSFARVGLARADSSTTMPGLGIAPTAIGNNDFGIVYGAGVIEGVDTSAFTDGQVLYVSSTVAGGFTTTEPSHPNLAQRIGVVVNASATDGSILVLVDHAGGTETGTNRSTFTVGTSTATSVVLANTSTSQRTATFQDKNGTVAYLEDVSPGFYGVVFAEGIPAGYRQRDDELNFDANFFYLTNTTQMKPYVSYKRFHRDQLTSGRTFWVRTDGSDSNDGLTNTAGGAFLTILRGFQAAQAMDLSTFQVTIQLGNAGTYAGATLNRLVLGSAGNNVLLNGDASNPTAYVISSAVAATNGARLNVSGISLQSSGNGLVASDQGTVSINGRTNFAACTAAHIICARNAVVNLNSNYTISGGATIHLDVSQGGTINATQALTCAVTGTPAFSTAFAQASVVGTMSVGLAAYSGAATGTRYNVVLNGVINTSGGGANFFPGDVAGTTATGGQYA